MRIFFFIIAMTIGVSGCSLAAKPQLSSQAQPAPEPSPAPQAQPAPEPQAAPLPQTPLTQQSASAPTPGEAAGQTGQSGDKIQHDLDVYANSYLETMNKHIKPSIREKEVVPEAGGFLARYKIIDPASLQATYRISENKAIAYVGRVTYHEVEYVSSGKTKAEALAGPFSEINRRSIIDIIMHIKGKWTYKY